MAKLNTVLRVAILFYVSLNISCITVPIEVTVPQIVEITEKEVSDISEKIFNFLLQINLTPTGPGISEDQCRAAFKLWLRKQFDLGRVPKGLVTPLEYGIYQSDPDFFNCPNINLETEYKDANEKYAKDAVQNLSGGLLFDASEHRDAVAVNKCAENFVDLKRNKIDLIKMSVEVLENTLTISSPPNNIYTGFDVAKDELEEEDGVAKLLDEGALTLLGTLERIPSKFVGQLPIVLATKQFRRAALPLTTLDGILAVIPEVLGAVPETTKIAGREYYIIPGGKMRLQLTMTVNISASLRDVKCVFDMFKESIREEESRP
jgi:hypothetical protein